MLKTAYLEGRRSSVLEFPTGAPAVLLITSQGFFLGLPTPNLSPRHFRFLLPPLLGVLN